MKNLSGFLFSARIHSQFSSRTLYNVSFFFFLFLFSFCAPERTLVTDLDVLKVIDRVSYSRFSDRLENEDPGKLKTDREIFLETCELYRLNPDSVLEKLQKSNPKLFQHLKETHEQ